MIKSIPDRFYKVETMCDIVVLREKTNTMENGRIEVHLCNLMEPIYIDKQIAEAPYVYDKYIDS